MTGNQNNAAEQIETLTVPADDVVEALRFNGQPPEYTNRRSAVLRVSPPFDTVSDAAVHYSEEGTRYPPDMSPKPVHIEPWRFVSETPAGPGSHLSKPERHESCTIAADERGEDREDVPDSVVDEYHTEALEVWEDEVRAELRDTITFRDRNGNEREVSVQYNDASHIAHGP